MDIFEGQEINPKVTDQVKEYIKLAILENRIKPGEKLPTEDNIAKRFSISRASVREALSELRSEGLVERRRGAYGGTFVSQPSTDRIMESILNCYKIGGLTLAEAVEFRRLMEPLALELACEKRTNEDLEKMRINLEETRAALSEGRVEREKHIDFHRLIAAASHNRLVRVTTEAAINVTFAMTSQMRPLVLEAAAGDIAFNQLFYQHILERNPANIRDLMEEHFAWVVKLTDEYKPEK